MQVLIADDNPLALAMLRNLLAGAGHEVLAARDGREAMETLRRGPCRLVITGVIVADAGAHFDPDVVEAFLGAEPAFEGIRERFSEAQTAAA